jgi:EAL domain-containing protein (putative c-di-GMP-specific phosphodiesterase class I)
MVTASVGISDGGIPVESAADLLARADAAMYRAKKLGKHRFFRYDENLHARAARDKQTESLLRTAVVDRRVVVHYQPIMATTGAGVVGVEAMARLVDHDGRMRLPGEFLPVAERTGLIAAMDTWVLAESCRRIAEVGGRLGRPLTVSVNVSAQLAARPDLVDTVSRSLTAAGLPASALMLELTEGTLIQAGTSIIERLTALRDRGVRVALDNFGAGYSPLAFLRRLPLSHVKVDRPYITRMLSDERDAAMLEAVTWLVGQLGLTWIAEGVETDAQWEAVRRFGPGFAQGYLFAAPLSEDDLVRTLRGEPAGRKLPTRTPGFASL